MKKKKLDKSICSDPIKGAATARKKPATVFLKSPFADHIPGLKNKYRRFECCICGQQYDESELCYTEGDCLTEDCKGFGDDLVWLDAAQ